MSPSMLGSSPSSTGAFSEASMIMTYEDEDEEKDYVCFEVLYICCVKFVFS